MRSIHITTEAHTHTQGKNEDKNQRNSALKYEELHDIRKEGGACFP